MARGADVVFPKNTPMEIRFGTHESSNPPPDGKKTLPLLPGKPSKASWRDFKRAAGSRVLISLIESFAIARARFKGDAGAQENPHSSPA
jgi:hypothetical protein